MSDAFLPYLGGKTLGLEMSFHWCFISHIEKILPFLLIGLFSFGSISLLSEYYLQYDEILFNFMPELIKFVSLSIVIYYILTLITDKQTRSLTKNILNEFKH